MSGPPRELPQTQIKALIVEDDVEVALIVRVLSDEGWVAEHRNNGLDAIRQARSTEYDVILLGWTLPDIDGLAVCRELRRAGSIVSIIMLTARGEVSDRVRGLETGADDCLDKPFESAELLARIRALLRRTHGFGSLQVGALEIDRLHPVVTIDGKPIDLTGREHALLLCLAREEGHVIARSELIARIWPTHVESGSNLVDVQISRLRDKLGGYAWMIETVRGNGYRLRRQLP
jgi:DNA-binding response OmpR family regulator